MYLCQDTWTAFLCASCTQAWEEAKPYRGTSSMPRSILMRTLLNTATKDILHGVELERMKVLLYGP